jgi:CRP-like cAMP-binding protein
MTILCAQTTKWGWAACAMLSPLHHTGMTTGQSSGIAGPFVRKLRHGARLTSDDEALLADLVQGVRRVHARGDIVREGDQALSLILEGWACNYRQLENGKRQIISLFVPGDLCQPFGILPRFLDHSFAAITPVTLAQVSLAAIRNAARASPLIEEALWWDLLVAAATNRERVVSLGRRTAAERFGHLLCELQLRLSLVGLADEAGYDLPITQADLADLLGLSVVHVNRSLRDLRRSGLMSLSGRRLAFRDLDKLRAASLFDPQYLHLDDTVLP